MGAAASTRPPVRATWPLTGSVLLLAFITTAAAAHPHPGGLVVRPDGTVIAGDILGLRLFVIEPDGRWHGVPDVGHVRGLAVGPDGTLHGVSWGPGGGIWTLGHDRIPVSLVAGFHGLMAAGAGGALLLAPGDAEGRGERVEIRLPDGQHRTVATLADITALAGHGEAVLVAAGSTLYRIAPDGSVTTLAEHVGTGVFGLTVGPGGAIVAAFGQRQVVEVGFDGARRILLTSEPPWGPTGVAFHDGALYVLELAGHACCWKGPRVRRLVAGGTPTTLLTIDDGRHLHLSPFDCPSRWMAGAGAVTALGLGVLLVRRRRRSPRAR